MRRERLSERAIALIQEDRRRAGLDDLPEGTLRGRSLFDLGRFMVEAHLARVAAERRERELQREFWWERDGQNERLHG